MIYRLPAPKSQRAVVFISVIAFHLALLLAFLASRNSAPQQVGKSGAMSLIAINADVPAQRLPPPPVLPSKLIDEIRTLAANTPAFEPGSTAPNGPASQCATIEVVANAIVADPIAVAAVIGAPPETRSITEAIVMWNAGWSKAADTAASPLSPARLVVEKSLQAVEDGCLDEPIAGPRLIPVPVGNSQRTMFLVFGSGHWTWRELVSPPTANESPAPDQKIDKASYEIEWF